METALKPNLRPSSFNAARNERMASDENGLAVFELIRRHGALASVVHGTFDLLELDGLDLRREPIEKRKALLAQLLHGSHLSIVLNERFEEDGASEIRGASSTHSRDFRVERVRISFCFLVKIAVTVHFGVEQVANRLAVQPVG